MLARWGFGLILFQAMAGNLLASQSVPESEDYKALTILIRNCAGCHQAADHPGALFLNAARLTEDETILLVTKLVETSQMPPAHKNFKSTADGKKLIRWLKNKEKRRVP